jgi:arabinogalactan endo-1,4-beta-galactosidase
MKFLRIVLIVVYIVSLVACKNNHSKQQDQKEFIIGADISIVDKIEAHGGVYTVNGQKTDPIDIFMDNVYNYSRIRLFHTPNMEGPVCQDIEYALNHAKRVKKKGMKVLLNFHYSDTWADPGKQYKPMAWEGVGFEALKDSVYDYTLRVMNAFAREGIIPDMVQTGNEINHGMIWPDGRLRGKTEALKEKQWQQFTSLFNAGVNGVRDSKEGKNIPVMIHIACGGEKGRTQYFMDNFEKYVTDYQIIGQSYYPWWHGTFDMLEENIQFMTEQYQKDIIIVETGYQMKGDQFAKGKYLDNITYPLTPQGQHDFLKELHHRCLKYPSVKGIFYWQPEGIKTPQNSGLKHSWRSLFDENGEILVGIKAFKGNSEK